MLKIKLMQLLVVIFCLFIFFYSLYILGKDDYVLIRKNFSLEQLFDFAFIGVFVSVILAKILLIVFHITVNVSFVERLFFPTKAGFSLTSIVLGYLLVVFLIGIYRKLPIGRLFDFFSLALLSTLPAGYLLSILFVEKNNIIFYILPGIFYLILQVFFWRFLLPRIINGKLRDGNLCNYFLLIFSAVSIFIYLFYKLISSSVRIEAEEFILLGLFFGSFIFLLYSAREQIVGLLNGIIFSLKRGERYKKEVGNN